MEHRTSSASVVSTRTARCRLPILDPASEKEVAREIPAARRCGGGYGGEIPVGLRQAAAGERRERRGRPAARVQGCCAPALPSSLYRHVGQTLPLPHALGPAAKGGRLAPQGTPRVFGPFTLFGHMGHWGAGAASPCGLLHAPLVHVGH